MHRPVLVAPAPPSRHQRWQESASRLLAPLTLWLCVTVTIRYGYYGTCRMVLGPSSSRLMKASSLFVKQIEVRGSDKQGVLLYGFEEKPELSVQTNWSVSNYLIVGSYDRKGFSLWLNKGSTIRVRWEAQPSSLNDLQVFLIKGERKYETLLPNPTNSSAAFPFHESTDGTDIGREAEYTILEDDRYYVGIINANRRSVIMTLSVDVASKMYDISKAKSMCSTIRGPCRLNLLFPVTQFVILTTPNNGDLVGWYVELSFVARVVTYVSILGFAVIIIFLVLKYLGACEGEEDNEIRIEDVTAQEVAETDPLLPEKPFGFAYGTGDDEEDPEPGVSGSSSDDLYDGKICVICYDGPRNCFFVPCGHCATCHDCSKRIIEGENKVCPICRRLIHKVRRLIAPNS